ncbi:MAG: tyrosine-type recombinase/integrase [Actinomycetota bacterium]
MNINEAISAFVVARKAVRKMAPTTERIYKFHLAQFAEHVGPATEIGDIDSTSIVLWMASLTHLMDSSLRTATEPLRSLFAWAVDEGIVETDPTTKIPRPKQTPAEYRGLPPEVVARTLHVADFRQRTLILLVLHLGLRCCELSRANIEDWDRHGTGWLAVRGKGGRGRVTRQLPVADESEWVLSMWVDSLPNKRGPLFPSMHGDRLKANSISQIFTKVAQRASVDATSHQYRHTCAHHLLAHGSLLNAVQRVLGHTNPTTTGIYLAASDDELRGVNSRSYAIGSALGPAATPAAIAA